MMQTKLITMLLAGAIALPVSADIFISEYIEGSSNNKALELYNSSSDAVVLDDYTIELYSNGNSNIQATYRFNTNTTINANSTFVIGHSSADSGITGASDLTVGLGFNGDDTLIMKDPNGAIIDVFGQYEVRPSGSWNVNGVNTKDATLRRKASVMSGDNIETDTFDPSLEWDAFPKDTFDGLGKHNDDGPNEPGSGEIITPCLNCPNLSPVADPETFDASTFYANIASAIGALSGSPSAQEVADIKALINDAAQQNQKVLTYSEVWSALTATDEDRGIAGEAEPNADNIRLFYSGRSIPKTENASAENANEDDFWNREHTWPSSHGFGSNIIGAYTDIHHLRPSDRTVNSDRGDKDFDFGGNEISDAIGNFTDNDSFEPRDEVKGDVARQMFYMDTRYEGEQSDQTPDLSLVNRLTDSTENVLGKLCVLIQWHTNDPVSDEEKIRHDKIYQYQGNRNPYIDNPAWADLIYPAIGCDQIVDPVDPIDPVDPVDPIDPVDPVDPPSSGASPLILTAVFDGTLSGGLPKGVEIYVAQNIPDLSVCGIGSANNGKGSDGEEFTFPAGVSAAAGDFIYVASKEDGFDTYFNRAPDYTSSAMSINGDDAIELFCNDEVVDLFGDINVDGTGQTWEYKDSYAKRKSQTQASAVFIEDNWEFAGPDTLDGAGNGDAINIGSFELAQADLFISEYAEGGSLNKAIELVNITGRTIELTDYIVQGYQNGADSPSYTIALEGVFENNSVFVLANNGADLPEIAGLLQRSGSLSFNGDDSVVLVGPDGVVDAIGQIGVDPGSEWGTGLASTKDNTLRRKSSITTGDTNANDEFDPSIEWDGFAKDSMEDFGLYGDLGGGNGGGTVVELGLCGAPATLISTIQGSGDSTPLSGEMLVLEGVVTLRTEGLSGFFVQEEDSDNDADSSTSEGVFVFSPDTAQDIVEGDIVRVLGEASEFNDKTQVIASEILLNCGTASVTPVVFELPLVDGVDLEAIEGMLVENLSDLVVTGSGNYVRFGEVVVASERLFTPTHLYLPGSEDAIALAEKNANNQLILDDLFDGFYNPTATFGELSSTNPLRLGSVVTSSTFVMDYGFNNYRLRPVGDLNYVLNNRPAAPVVGGNIKVASYNVLNLFNGDGNGNDEGYENSRGAENDAEYQLQLSKIVQALIGLDASVIGLMELENDGYDELSSISQLVDALNIAYGEQAYAFVDAGQPLGTDAIAVGLLYKTTDVSLAENFKVLDSENSIVDEDGPLFDTNRNRPSLAQKFTVNETGSTFVVNVNHLKSKGSSCGAGDDDVTNGQANCNLTRTRAAEALHVWLAAAYTNEPIMIVGDLNAYGQEDPIIELHKSWIYRYGQRDKWA